METIDDRALDTLLELIGGDVASLRRLIATFTEETADIVDGMRDAASEGDVRALHRGAHNVRTGARYVGANRLEALAVRLESLLGATLDEPFERDARTRAADDVETISLAFDDARDVLRRWIDDPCRR